MTLSPRELRRVPRMTTFINRYINCLTEALNFSRCPDAARAVHLRNRQYDSQKSLVLNGKFSTAKALLDEVKGLMDLVTEAFKNQTAIEKASDAYLKIHKTAIPLLFEVSVGDALHFFKLLTGTFNQVEQELINLKWIETPPQIGTEDSKAYFRLLFIVESIGFLLAKPSMFSHMQVTTFHKQTEKAYIHMGDIVMHSFSSAQLPFLETLAWDSRHTFLEAHFKGAVDTFVYTLPIDQSPTKKIVESKDVNNNDSEASSQDSDLPDRD